MKPNSHPDNTKNVLVGIIQRRAGGESEYDALDRAWSGFLLAAGIYGVPVPNGLGAEARAWFRKLGLRGLVLSGGGNISSELRDIHGKRAGAREPALPELGDTDSERESLERELVLECIERGLPVLGVCRGFQFLNVFHGGGLAKVEGHVRSTHRLEAKERPFAGLEVNSFHNYGIPRAQLAPELDAEACAPDGTVEAARHRSLPHYGIMWHPERAPLLHEANIALFRRVFQDAGAA